jgi:hypothetical protein
MDYTQIAWMLFLIYVFLYVVLKILDFYGIGSDVYGIYLGFLIFILLSIVILPHSYSIIDE